MPATGEATFRASPENLVATEWLLSAGGNHHHGHRHGHDHGHQHHNDAKHITTSIGTVVLNVFEDGVSPRFRLHVEGGPGLTERTVSVETIRPDGVRQLFTLIDCGDLMESAEEVPDPHAFTSRVHPGNEIYPGAFEEHEHADGAAHRNNNMRAAVIHVVADAAVSVLVIAGLLLASAFG